SEHSLGHAVVSPPGAFRLLVPVGVNLSEVLFRKSGLLKLPRKNGAFNVAETSGEDSYFPKVDRPASGTRGVPCRDHPGGRLPTGRKKGVRSSRRHQAATRGTDTLLFLRAAVSVIGTGRMPAGADLGRRRRMPSAPPRSRAVTPRPGCAGS